MPEKAMAHGVSLPVKWNVTIEPGRASFSCMESESLLQAMSRLGRRVIPVGCVNGGCGVCKVKILSGDFEVGIMSRAHVSEDEQRAGTALACKVYPRSELLLRVVGKLSKYIRT